jgi:response regulator RpfG family c-di-GMP phosphodiesterase
MVGNIVTVASSTTVLVVNDATKNLCVLSELLSQYYRVLVAGSRGSSLRMTGGQPRPDLILLDIMMLGLDGYGVQARLGKNPVTRIIPFLCLTVLALRQHLQFAATVNDRYIDQITGSAPFHDISKGGIPDSILLKPGPLTTTEWVIMRSHARLGNEAIERAEREITMPFELLGLAKEIAHWQREKWDGCGYPDGLAEEGILVSAWLMALADVCDALVTSHVYYKNAIPSAIAHDIIASGHGSKFDPDATDDFLTDITEYVAIAERYKDDTFSNSGLVRQ